MSVSAVRNLGKLENKLQQLLVKNNLMEKDNVRKKKHIDDLRKEKIQQVQVTQKFERTVSGKKSKVVALVAETQQLQDKKEKVLREIEVMKQKILDELDANNDEYNSLKAELSMNQLGSQETLTPDQLALEKKKREAALKKQVSTGGGNNRNKSIGTLTHATLPSVADAEKRGKPVGRGGGTHHLEYQ
jgi:hypothetical protein